MGLQISAGTVRGLHLPSFSSASQLNKTNLCYTHGSHLVGAHFPSKSHWCLSFKLRNMLSPIDPGFSLLATLSGGEHLGLPGFMPSKLKLDSQVSEGHSLIRTT